MISCIKLAKRRTAILLNLSESEKSPVLAQRIASAKCFGIIEGKSNFFLTDMAKRYYFPTTDGDRGLALLEFFRTPSSFAEVIKRFDGSKLPSREILANIFQRECRVPESWKVRIAAFFSNSADFIGVLDGAGFLRFRAAKDRCLSKLPTEVSVSSVEPNRKDVTSSTTIAESKYKAVNSTESTVWDFSYQGRTVRIITPTELDEVLWSKLDAYIKLLKPTGGKIE